MLRKKLQAKNLEKVAKTEKLNISFVFCLKFSGALNWKSKIKKRKTEVEIVRTRVETKTPNYTKVIKFCKSFRERRTMVTSQNIYGKWRNKCWPIFAIICCKNTSIIEI
jgi:hypothetical protein